MSRDRWVMRSGYGFLLALTVCLIFWAVVLRFLGVI